MAKIDIGALTLSKMFVGNSTVRTIYLGNTKIYESVSKLATPSITIVDDDLIISAVPNAEYYDIYVDDTLEDTITVGN